MPDNAKKTRKIIDLLIQSYNAEIETVMNYIANASNLDGVRAKEVKESLSEDIREELGHAQKLAARIHTLEGIVPGSQALSWEQSSMQPPKETTDVVSVIKGVIEAEETAIDGYQKIIQECDGFDWVTQDLAIQLKADEEQHRREFIGFLREYENDA